MLLSVSPQSTQSLQFSRNQRLFGVSLLLLMAVMMATIGCSSLNAGSTSTSKPLQPIAIAASLPPATVGSAYNAVISVSGGTGPYNFALRSGSFPPGLYINATTGTIAGNPIRSGSYAFLISVLDKNHTAEGVQKFAMTVGAHSMVAVAVSPASLNMASGSSHQFAAQISNSTNHGVTWWASAGKITSAGLFTAPAVNAATNVQIIATSKADLSKNAFVSVTVNAAAVVQPSSSLTMTSVSLPDATEGIPYSAGLRASGGTAPYQWKISSGSLPTGLAFNASQGSIIGIASQTGPFPITVQASDGAGASVARQFTISVAATAATGNFDGPAELPRVYIQSSLADTPAPGASHSVSTMAALQSALASAQCGDKVLLKAGTTFSGTVVLPAKNCDDNHWIVVRTDAPDSALPPEGTRVSPCYAGVASLPGRPSFKCSSTQNVLAKIVFMGTGSGPVVFADGANHYRLIGLEITRGTPKDTVFNLIINERGGAVDHIVLDRSWVHGTAQDETVRGLILTASTNFAVVDSFFSDFHCISMSGSCGDSQAIAGGLGDKTMGPYKIVNNFLEAGGENIIFGGGEATRTPEDIEIRRNHFFKPLIWMKGTPGFVGGRDGHAFIVKNHLEFKNAARILVDGNVMENTWGGFTQSGFSILITPKNQGGMCPLCVVHDVTIRNGTISHTGAGVQIGNGLSDSGALSLGAWNESLHDLIITHVNGKTYGGGGYLFQEANGNEVNPLHNIAISHVTAIGDDPPAAMLVLGNDIKHPLVGITWKNNIFSSPGPGIMTTGGGAANCAYPALGNGALGKLDRCFTNYEFSGNVLIGATGPWPANNHAPTNVAGVMFASAIHTLLSSFELLPVSPYSNQGTDGKNPGANVIAVQSAISGVVP